MTIDRAIDISSKFSMGCHVTLRDGEIQEYNQLCFSAICSQREAEKNEPLTWDELVLARGCPIFISANFEYWAIVQETFEADGDIFVSLLSSHDEDDCGCRSQYGPGLAWIAYRRPPGKEA